MRWHCSLIALFATLLSAGMSLAVPPDAAPPPPDQPQIAAASDEAEKAMKSFRVPAGLEVRLFAAEPDLANPVAFTIANDGKVFVCETFRQGKGVEDNRGHEHWLDDDLAAQTVEDRLAYIRKHLKEKAEDYAKHDDRIRLIEDTNGDGRADKATVFADRFNSIVEGTGAGVLTHGKDVFFTCIPHLWLLRDEDGNGQADVRKSLSSGYGVRCAFRGHDMHGLIVGPDGKLYFSIGDRGLNVKQGDKHFVNPESGAVLRCNLDGSELEMIHTGLRNPQELAFDDYGNLFTGDNNSDSGDQARWTMIAEGADTGWRMSYQYLSDRGPFNREKIWHTYHEGQPAYILPPIAAGFVSGPSGLAFYPGTGLPEHYKDRFFLVDFRGGPSNSGVRTFRVKPKGAFFELTDQEETLWSILATDVEFGPDGAIYVSDWVNGWNGEGKGRIYKYVDPTQEKSPLVLEVRKYLAEGFAQRSIDELVGLLGHADRRVRQGAQFALVDKNAIQELAKLAASTDAKQLARIHAIWGLGMLARIPKQLDYKLHPVLKLLDDADAEIRAQATKILGDRQFDCAYEPLIAMLDDPSARVQYFAAQGLGKFGRRDAIPALVNRIAENADEDPALRHACIMGLAGACKVDDLGRLKSHESSSVRLAAVVALRHLEQDAILIGSHHMGVYDRYSSGEHVAVTEGGVIGRYLADFLGDSEPKVVVEAARAIHDLPIVGAYSKLAALISKSTDDDALLRRVLNANYRLGGAEHALAIAEYAARGDAPKHLRLEALEMLESWDKPYPKDRVLGMWRPLAERSAEPAVAALKKYLPGILIGDDAVRSAAAKTAAKLGVKEINPALVELFSVKTNAPSTRADALTALVALKDAKSDELLKTALADESAEIRAAARNAMVSQRPMDALPLLEAAALKGEQFERQAALATLATVRLPGTNEVVVKALDQLLAGETPDWARLDVLEAAGKRADSRRGAVAIKEKLKEYEARKPADQPLAAYHETLAGGNAQRGRKLFLEKSQLSCVRCHKVGETGGDVGPALSKIGGEKNREYLLESIVTPSKTIAKGFDTAVIVNDEGQIVSGIVKAEDEKELRLMTPEGKLLTIPKATIEERSVGRSAMPEDLLKHLSKSELRDLVEFLSTLR